MIRAIAVCVALVVVSFGCRTPGQLAIDLDPLNAAVEQLRTKTIHEGYFHLLSPQLPAGSHIFAPDTKGGAYVLIARDTVVPQDVDMAALRADYEKNWDAWASRYAAGPPRIDAKSRKVIFYSRSEWNRLRKAVRPWTVDQASGPLLFRAERQSGQRYLTIRVPKQDQAEFLRIFLSEGLGLDHAEPTYEIGWN